MKRLIILLTALCLLSLSYGQTSIDLTFTAIDGADYSQLDSIKVMNQTQGNESMIYWPDTSLSVEINPGDLLQYVGYATFTTVGISEVNDDISSFTVYQNYPNPFQERSEVTMHIPQKGIVHVLIRDLQGKVVVQVDRHLDAGHHSFRFFSRDSKVYFLTAYWNGISSSIKMISTGLNDGKSCRLDYLGSNPKNPVLKASVQFNDLIVRQSGIVDYPEDNTTYTFQFATNIPCPGTPTVEYEGQVYNTIQIYSQCWLKENLNVGTMIDGSEEMTDNGIIEKYCYNNQLFACTEYGGLYQWHEMMQYTTQHGAKGICPPGWHLPTDEEWKILEGITDTQYDIGDSEWDGVEFRGYDAGKRLKSTTSHWHSSGNGIDAVGFKALPGGGRYLMGDFFYLTRYGAWWSSSEVIYNEAWTRFIMYNKLNVSRIDYVEEFGLSVRCIKD